MAIGALSEYGHRSDTDADVGTAFHVAGLAAWVEHVCNVLLDPVPSNWRLEEKLTHIWEGHINAKLFRKPWNDVQQSANAQGHSTFDAKLAFYMGHAVPDGFTWMARDARLAQCIRNEGAHAGLRSLTRDEAHEAAAILLRVAFGAWLVRH